MPRASRSPQRGRSEKWNMSVRGPFLCRAKVESAYFSQLRYNRLHARFEGIQCRTCSVERIEGEAKNIDIASCKSTLHEDSVPEVADVGGVPSIGDVTTI